MADVTNALGFRKLSATRTAALYFFATLHGTGGSALTSSIETYAVSGLGELATANGYTAGGLSLGTGTVVTNTNVDTGNAVWTASGTLGPASYAALWVNTTNSITGAQLVLVKDSAASPQTASDGQTMTWTLTNEIQY